MVCRPHVPSAPELFLFHRGSECRLAERYRKGCFYLIRRRLISARSRLGFINRRGPQPQSRLCRLQYMVDKVAFRCVDEFGADFVGQPPDAAVRYVGNPAVPRRVADAALDLADAANGVAPRASSIHPHRLAILQVWLRKPAL